MARPELADKPNGLRAVLEAACSAEACPASALTVLSTPVDPYRLDTPTGRAEGAWLAEQMGRLGLEHRQIHLRGLHYALVSTAGLVKPNGELYRNTERDWLWLQSSAAKAARWLGFVPFDTIVDERNAAPVIRVQPTSEPSVEIGLGAEVEINVPDLEDIRPTVYLEGFGARQAYRLVLTGEKTSLADVVAPIAERHDADLYLPSGEISDTLVYLMAKTGAEDGRPMIVLVMADFDPAGRQMAVSIARKLQGFRDLHFPDLEFEVHAIALNEDQVRELGLPSTPLKETERRADRWRLEFGLEQTEIDALATLRPDALRRIVEKVIAPFYDNTLERRTRDARFAFVDAAQAELEARVDSDLIEALHAEAEAKLATVRAEVDAINDQLRTATDTLGIYLSPPEPPAPELPEGMKGKAYHIDRLAMGRADARAQGPQGLRQRRARSASMMTAANTRTAPAPAPRQGSPRPTAASRGGVQRIGSFETPLGRCLRRYAARMRWEWGWSVGRIAGALGCSPETVDDLLDGERP